VRLLLLAVAGAAEPVEAPPPPAAAEAPAAPVTPPQADLAFADVLYAEGDFEGARLEYRRALWAGVPDGDRAALRVGECLGELGRFEEAEGWFAGLHTDVGDLGRGLTMARARRHDAAATALERVGGSPELQAVARWAAGWARLDARQEAFARADFAAVQAGPLAAPAREVLVQLDRAPRARHRAPGVAAALSFVVPGAGQAWSGNWGDAAAAFFVNAAFAAGTVELARTEQVPGAVALGLVGATFWGGNVLAAADSARRFDETSWAARLQPLGPLRCDVHLTPEPGCG
jgi:hypothetical protein